MKKRLWGMFLALSMVLTLLPVSVMAEEDAAIGANGETTVVEPMDETEAIGETIPDSLTDETEESLEVGISAEELELPYVAQIGTTGYTTLQAAIYAVEEGQTIELLDNIHTESVNIYATSFTLDLKGNTLGGFSYPVIYHYGSNTLTISDTAGGGKITGCGSSTIELDNSVASNTVLNITGGTIENTTAGKAIYNLGKGKVAITGGTVRATASKGTAIYNQGSGDLLISSGMVENTADGNAIYNFGYGIVEIAGGTVRAASGTGIHNGFDVVRITGGPSTIIGGIMATNYTPDCYYYTNVKILGSTHADGADASEILDEGFDTELYKYLRFEEGTAKAAYIGTTGYYTLQAAVDAVTNGGTIRLHSNITLEAAITVSSDESKNFTLNLAGRTLDSGTNTAIEHRGSGTLTITDTSRDGKITGINTSSGTVVMIGGSLVVSRCTVENTAAGKAIYNSGSGSVSISDVTVRATAGTAICNEFGSMRVAGGTSTIIGGTMAMNAVPDLSYYTYINIMASRMNTDGTGTFEIAREDVDTVTKVQNFKYLKFEQSQPKVARIGTTYYPNLQAAVDAVKEGDTIELQEDITLTAALSTSKTYRNFTLDLKGNILNSGTNTALIHNGDGILTIIDTAKGGKVSSKNTSSGTIYLDYNSRLVVSGSRVENTAGNAIYHGGNGYISISDFATVTSANTDGGSASDTIYLNAGMAGSTILKITGSTIENATTGNAIYNSSSCNVIISDSIVRANNGTAIYNNSTGKITIIGSTTITSTNTDSSSGSDTIYLNDGIAGNTVLEITGSTIENTSVGNTIYNSRSGNVMINGGAVSANKGTAIYNNSTGKISIKGTTTVTSAKPDSGSGSGTIYLNAGEAGKTVLEISNGTIGNTTTGNAIYNNGSGSVSFLNGISTIRGGNMAMNMMPDLSNFTNVKITASITNVDGADASEITQDSIDTDDKVQAYKYLQFESFKVAQIGTTSYTSLKAAIDAVPDGGTIELLKDITLTAAVGTGNNKSYTLDLKGKKLDGVTSTAIDHGGNGTLTITDTADDDTADDDTADVGIITSTNENGATIVSSGTLNIAGGIVIGSTGTAISNYDKVIVSGGTVKNISEGRAIFNFETIEVTGGMVSAKNGIAIDNFEYGSVNVSGGTVSANGGHAILNRGEGKITISDTALVTNESNSSTIYLMEDNPYGYTLKIKGGTVENTAAGDAIDNRGYGHVEIFGGTISSKAGTAIDTLIGSSEVFILEGTSIIIKGGYMTMNKFPNFYDYDNVRIRVSETDGTDTSDVLFYYFHNDKKKFKAYKYLMFEPATVPDPPTNLAVTPLNGRLSLTWDAPANNGGREIIGYKISTDNGSSWTVSYSIYNPRTVDGLTNGATYTVLVRAFNEIGDGPVSDSITVTLPVPTYTIRGSIKDRETNSGIAGAVVQLMNGSSKVGSPVLTDSNGAYTISNVIEGTYSIEVSADGYDRGTVSSFYVYYNATNKNLMLTKYGSFISVTDIVMTDGITVQVNNDLPLSGTVVPDTATNRTITWSIENANGTGATINGNTFRATSPGNATVKATVTNGLTTSSDYTKSFTITVLLAPVVTHTITTTADDGGSISPNGSVTINNGTSQTFTITPSDNYSIADVKVDGVSQGSITSYTFHNVTANHTILATFSYNGSGGGDIPPDNNGGGGDIPPDNNGGGGGDIPPDNNGGDGGDIPSDNNGGGGSPSDNNSDGVITTPPVTFKPNSPTQGEIKINGTVDSKGNAAVNITNKAVTNAINKALEDAKKNGNEQNGITLVLNVSMGTKTADNVTVNLPKTVQDTIIAKKIAGATVVVDNPDIIIGMDLLTVKEINKQANSNVNITATCVDKLTGAAKKAIGRRPVFDLTVNYGSDKQVRSFGKGSVSVTIPYTLGANEKAGNVCAVYVDSKGKVHWLNNSVYDSVEKVLRFTTSHFSTYGVGYKQDSPVLADISNHWAKEAIEFVVSRGLFSGTSTTTFSPDTAMTRGMFVTALGRLANADVSKYKKSSFTDVKKDAYYMGYIEWAKKNNILNGTDDGKFAPNQSITREQMAVIMQKYAKIIDFTLPKVHEENFFTDSSKISADAKNAVKQMQMAGVISGKNNNLLDPQGTATRAEVSMVLRRFVSLVISSDTMQGWTMNDSGQWMYYENGKPVTGKKDIHGLTYIFNQYGVTTDVPKSLK